MTQTVHQALSTNLKNFFETQGLAQEVISARMTDLMKQYYRKIDGFQTRGIRLLPYSSECEMIFWAGIRRHSNEGWINLIVSVSKEDDEFEVNVLTNAKITLSESNHIQTVFDRIGAMAI